MKNLKNLRGAKELSKSAQQTVKGGKLQCDQYHRCPVGFTCINGTCEREILPWD